MQTVIVGASKPVMNYVTACVTLFNKGEEQITIRARGKAISNAVEVVQLLRNTLMNDIVMSNANVDGESVSTKDGRDLILPVLELIISRGRRLVSDK